MIISDGTGTGNQVKVDRENRLRAHSTVVTESTFHNVEDATAYNINTGIITLTSDSESSVMYVKNTDSDSLIITAIAVGLGPSTGGASSTIPTIKITRNPTAGTVIDDATEVDISSNRNFGSSNSPTGFFYKGGEGKTLTGDTDHIIFFQNSGGRLYANIDEVLPKGSSIGVKITPQTSNTNMQCYAALIGYVETGEI